MFNSQMSAVSAERDALQTELLAEQDKVPNRSNHLFAEPKQVPAFCLHCSVFGNWLTHAAAAAGCEASAARGWTERAGGAAGQEAE